MKIHIPNAQSDLFLSFLSLLQEIDFERYMPLIMKMKKEYSWVQAW